MSEGARVYVACCSIFKPIMRTPATCVCEYCEEEEEEEKEEEESDCQITCA